jgi:hypothetical protein
MASGPSYSEPMSRIGSEDDSIGSGETALTPTSAASASHDIGGGESPSTQPRSQDPVGPGALSTATGVLSVATCATGVAIAVRSATQTLHIGVSGCTAVFSGLWVVDFRNTPADRPRIPSPRFSSRPIRDAAGRMIGRVSGRPAQRTLEAPRHRPRVLRAGFECQPLAVPQPSRRGARCRRGRCPVAASAKFSHPAMVSASSRCSQRAITTAPSLYRWATTIQDSPSLTTMCSPGVIWTVFRRMNDDVSR